MDRPTPCFALLVRSALALVLAAGVAACESDSSTPAARPGPNSITRNTETINSSAVTITDVVSPKMSTASVVNRVPRPSGLVVEDLKLGDGDIVFPGAVILFRHRGFVKSTGVCYEDSYKNDEPIEVSLREVPRSMKEGIPGMRVGGFRRLVIPAEMAFGARGLTSEETGEVLVGPDEVTVYEVELLGVKQTFNAPPDPAMNK